MKSVVMSLAVACGLLLSAGAHAQDTKEAQPSTATASASQQEAGSGAKSAAEPSAMVVGKFSGTWPLRGLETQWTLSCGQGTPCELAMAAPGQPVQAIPTQPPVAQSSDIANNNLQHTRKAVQARPDWYQHAKHGALLTSIRGFLDSEDRFDKCWLILDAADIRVCTLASDPDARNAVALLSGTMNGRCGDAPFCAYHYVLLKRPPAN